MLPDERGAILRRWAALIRENQADLARIMVLEQGKPMAEALGEIDYAASFPKTSLIMLGILAVCFFLTFFFPVSKNSGIPETKECDEL